MNGTAERRSTKHDELLAFADSHRPKPCCEIFFEHELDDAHLGAELREGEKLRLRLRQTRRGKEGIDRRGASESHFQ